MSFDVAAEAYGQFMGRYSEQLAVRFADAAGVEPGARILDVGCGPGALTAVLVERFGTDHVSAIDPSVPFVEAARRRFPGLEVQLASAEELPFPDDAYDAALAQLVVHFMTDPVGGLREMARVTRAGGVVAACVWDIGGRSPLSTFWAAVRAVDPEAEDESDLAGVREGHLAALATEAGLTGVESSVLSVSVRYDSFEEWWEPYLFGVGPAGSYLARVDDDVRHAVRGRALELLPPAPFEVVADAWCVRGRA